MTVLLVEDNDLNRAMLSKWLRRRGFDVVTAADGEQGLSAARVSDPDIILMDISLPVYDGLEVTRRLKADPATSRIPVVALTAHVSGEDRDQALAAGCHAFESKPIDFNRLLDTIKHCFHGVQS
jgi:CheY-like chemotaxis protein